MQDRRPLVYLNPQSNEIDMKINKEKTTTGVDQPLTAPRQQIVGMVEVVGRSHCPIRPSMAAKKRSAFFCNLTLQYKVHCIKESENTAINASHKSIR